MRQLIIDNYLIDKPILDILYDIQFVLTNGKLRDIKPGTDDIVVTCPFHAGGAENRPDMNIYIGDDKKLPYGYCRCFACDAKGPFYKLVAACFDKSEDFAKKWLIDHYGVRQKETISLGDPIVPKQQVIPTYLDEKELDKYQNYCYYLQKRKITRNVCEYFNVKYDPVKREVLFPCYNESGKLVMIPTRKIDYKQFYLPKDVEKPVYGLDKIIKRDISSVMIVEGLIDCLTGWSNNIPTIATLGNMSDTQINAINKSCITTIYLCMDNDFYGRRFTDLLKAKLAKRIMIYDVFLPSDKKDINDLTHDEIMQLKTKYNLPEVNQ